LSISGKHRLHNSDHRKTRCPLWVIRDGVEPVEVRPSQLCRRKRKSIQGISSKITGHCYQGDAQHGPNPCIAPIENGPFYAIKMVIGDLGTYAGIKTDEHARALDADGRVIDGLYAAGNDMASIMGGNYPGAGITLGPALTFGYIAGMHLATAGHAVR